MKIVARPIDAAVLFRGKEPPLPRSFRFQEERDGERITVRVEHVFDMEQTNVAGAPAFVYRCQSQIGEVMKPYELRYFVKECRWELYKI